MRRMRICHRSLLPAPWWNVRTDPILGGTTKLHRLDENIEAAAIELTSDDLREIDSAASKDYSTRESVSRTHGANDRALSYGVISSNDKKRR
jgi:hypothetical protein